MSNVKCKNLTKSLTIVKKNVRLTKVGEWVIVWGVETGTFHENIKTRKQNREEEEMDPQKIVLVLFVVAVGLPLAIGAIRLLGVSLDSVREVGDGE